MDKTQAKIGNLPITLATFIYLLHDSGIIIRDEKIQSVCTKLEEILRRASLQGCVEQIQDVLDKQHLSASTESIQTFLNGVYGTDVFEEININDVGMELVSAIESSLAPDANISDLSTWLAERYDNVNDTWAGDSREERIQSIRKHSFKSSLPWLAQIAERHNDELVIHWVLIEKFTDWVICMDPYPWDDIDEEYELPLNDFMVKWELAGSKSVFIAQ